MAVISPPILKLLSDLDIDLMDIDNDMDYLRALMEATNTLTITNPGDKRIPILQKEVKRVRDNRKAKSQITKKKISTSKLLNKKGKGDVGAKGMESNTGKLARILRDTRGKVLANEKKIDLLAKPKESEENENSADLLVIKEKVISIEALLGDQYKLKEDQAKVERKLKERKGRKLNEKLLEGGKKVWEGVKKTGEKILAPFQSVWDNIIGFIQKIILGRVLFKILEWAGDPKNQDKIKSIGKFFNDFWPVMLAGYLLFGNSLTSMVTGMLIQMGQWIAPMLLAIGKLMLNPWVAAAVGLGLTAAWLSTKKNKTDQNVDQSVEDVGEEETVNLLKEEKEDKNVLERMGGFVTGEGQERDEQIQRVETGEERSYGRGGFTGELINSMVNPVGSKLGFGFNKGGTVPGSGDTDTVPAMLTPGEFVMSKGAVQKYGADTLAGMNAAGGGTNIPTVSYEYNNGGIVDRGRYYPQMGSPISNTQTINYNNGGYIGKNIQPNVITNFNPVQKLSSGRFVNNVTRNFNSGGVVNGGVVNNITRNFNSGGLVPIQGFNEGGLIRRAQNFGKKSLNFVKNKIKSPNITPPEKKNTTVAYKEQGGSMKSSDNKLPQQTNKEVPSFSAIAMRSPDKINVLGISV